MSTQVGRWKPSRTIDARAGVQGGRIDVVDEHTVLVTCENAAGMTLPPGGLERIVFTGNLSWRAKSFSVPADIAQQLELVAMHYARVTYACEKPVPCALFSDATCADCRKAKVHEHLGVDWPIVNPGVPLVLEFRNSSDRAVRNPRGTFEGELAPQLL